MNWLRRLRLRWAFRRSLPTEGTAALPSPQGQQDDGEEAFRRAHGYSRATVPLPQTDEQAAHNRAIDEEYQAEIDARIDRMKAGEYRPRFYLEPKGVGPDGRYYSIYTDAMELWKPDAAYLADPANVNWHLELAMDPGRRLNVTTETGVAVQPLVTSDEVAERRVSQRIKTALETLEQQGDPVAPVTARQLVGTREQILKAVHGNEAMADQVEAKAREWLGVTDLDAPLL